MGHKYFLDSDVIIDYLLKRRPFNVSAREIFILAFNRKIEVATSSLAISNIHYISRKQVGRNESLKLIADFLELCKIISVSELEIREALKSNFFDFEDAIQHFSALSDPKIEGIITRNKTDFQKSELPVFTPIEFLNLFR